MLKTCSEPAILPLFIYQYKEKRAQSTEE